jgi:hypothetical protein
MTATHRLTRTVTGADGQSRFEDLELAVLPSGRAGRTDPLAATWASFVQAVDLGPDPHPAPRRQLVVVLQGVIEIGCGSGDKRRFGPGQVVLVEDTDGLGHSFQTIDGPVSILNVALADPPNESAAFTS